MKEILKMPPDLGFFLTGIGSGFFDEIKDNFVGKIFDPKEGLNNILKCAWGANVPDAPVNSGTGGGGAW